MTEVILQGHWPWVILEPRKNSKSTNRNELARWLRSAGTFFKLHHYPDFQRPCILWPRPPPTAADRK